MPIFCVKSVKIYTGQKIYTDGVSRVSDNYQVCMDIDLALEECKEDLANMTKSVVGF